MSVSFGLLDDKQKKRVLSDIAKESVDLFNDYKDAITEAFHFKKPDSKQRLEFYKTRLPQVWAALQEYNPSMYSKQLADWQELEIRRMNREFSAFNPFSESKQSPLPASEQGNYGMV